MDVRDLSSKIEMMVDDTNLLIDAVNISYEQLDRAKQELIDYVKNPSITTALEFGGDIYILDVPNTVILEWGQRVQDGQFEVLDNKYAVGEVAGYKFRTLLSTAESTVD